MITSIGEPQVQPSIDRLTTCSAPGWTPGLVEHVLEQHALEQRVADEVAADLVRHARQRDVALDQRPRQQVVEGQLDRWSTIPSICSLHESFGTCGTTSAVSIR